MTPKTERLALDAPTVTRDEALELMVHHLKLAAMYYEAVPEDIKAVTDEMERLMAEDPVTGPEPALLAARSWLTRIYKVYEAMKDKD